ncbi:MAG: TlpA family protein disulfide reductase [Bacteroidota bacterium]
MRKYWLVWAIIAWSAFARADTSAGDMLFAATFDDLAGQPRALAQWKGQPLLINFWARWCSPCRTEIPDLAGIHRRYQARGLNVIGIGIEAQAEPVRDFAKAYDMDYTVLIGQESGLQLMRALGNKQMGLPFTVAIDRAGKMVVQKMGALRGDELVAAAEMALR